MIQLLSPDTDVWRAQTRRQICWPDHISAREPETEHEVVLRQAVRALIVLWNSADEADEAGGGKPRAFPQLGGDIAYFVTRTAWESEEGWHTCTGAKRSTSRASQRMRLTSAVQ